MPGPVIFTMEKLQRHLRKASSCSRIEQTRTGSGWRIFASQRGKRLQALVLPSEDKTSAVFVVGLKRSGRYQATDSEQLVRDIVDEFLVARGVFSWKGGRSSSGHSLAPSTAAQEEPHVYRKSKPTSELSFHRDPASSVYQVRHRATGTPLGRVGRHLAHNGAFSKRWSWTAWGFLHDEGLGEGPAATRVEAAELLLDPAEAEPLFPRKRCQACRYGPVIGGRSEPCPDCETAKQAEARSRAEQPDAWVHHDLLAKLKEQREESP